MDIPAVPAVWTEAGLARAVGNGVDPADVATALSAPAHSRYVRRIDTLLLVAGAVGERVVYIVLTREDVGFVWKIFDVRYLSEPEIDDWKRRVR